MAEKRTDFNYYAGFQGDTPTDGRSEALGYYRYTTFKEFVDKVHKITGDVLITSPSDFSGLEKFLEKRQN